MVRLSFKLFITSAKLSLLFLLPLSNAYAAVSDITRIYHQTPTLEAFDICFGGGCAEIKQVSLSAEEWRKVKAVFMDSNSPQMNAEQERKKIANAIGVLETIVGLKIGTSKDLAGTFNSAAYPGQLDCNDEAINTTSYMRLMRTNNLIKLHEIEDMRTRNFFFTGWPHTTAVIHEMASGQRFAVDSWFYDNGKAATIVPFELWKSGYVPADSPLSRSHEVRQSSE